MATASLYDTVNVLGLRQLAEGEDAPMAEDNAVVVTGGPLGPQQLAFRQRMMAKLVAQGLPDTQVANAIGVSAMTVRNARSRPDFQELVCAMQEYIADELSTPKRAIEQLMTTAMEAIQHRVVTEYDTVGINSLVDVFRTAADRCGHAPVNKNVSVTRKLDREQLAEILEEIQDK